VVVVIWGRVVEFRALSWRTWDHKVYLMFNEVL
jgi:hypothetical protein